MEAYTLGKLKFAKTQNIHVQKRRGRAHEEAKNSQSVRLV
jgi:hypothetical protein